MSHLHIVHDSDAIFTIDPVTRTIKNESGKTTVIQGDHNSERFTFSIQKQVDGHDMSICNRVEIHYINIDATDKTKKATGMYEADDMKISSDVSGKVTFSWLLSRNATRYAGSLNFLIRFACIVDGAEEYAWNTAIFQGITVGSGMYYGGAEVIEPYFDVIAQWKNDLFGVGDSQEQRLLTVSAEQQAAIAAKGAVVLDSIPDEYTELQAGIDTLFNSVASGIRGYISGTVVRADDVSPIEHRPVVKVHGKNLFICTIAKTSTVSGVTCEFKENSSVVILNGTATMENSNVFPNTFILPKGTYTISVDGLNSASGGSDRIYLRNVLTNSVIINHVVTGVPRTFTLEESTEILCNIVFREASAYSNKTVTIQIEQGTTATEYTPYLDPSRVTVKRCSKNLIDRELMKESVTLNGVTITRNNDQIVLNGTLTVDSVLFNTHFCLFGGLNNHYTLSYKHMGGTVAGSASICVGDSETVDSARQSWANIKMQNSDNQYSYEMTKPFIKDMWFYAVAGVVFTNYRILIQLEPGKEATDFETCNGAEYMPAADGAVPGVTSVSPTMTILTDTDGAIVECDYIVDTKTYIDNKISELTKGVTA